LVSCPRDSEFLEDGLAARRPSITVQAERNDERSKRSSARREVSSRLPISPSRIEAASLAAGPWIAGNARAMIDILAAAGRTRERRRWSSEARPHQIPSELVE
jgi:hypothetical protein